MENIICNKIINKIKHYYAKNNINYIDGIAKIQNNIDSLINIETFEKIEKSFKYFSEYKITQNNI